MQNNALKLAKSAIIFFALLLSITFVSAAADFAVTSFSCTPTESVINNVFSCTVDIKNNGDASGSVNTATLYPDANDWLENSNYPQASGTSVNAGQSTQVTFSGLRAVKSGNNGFSKIMLDSVTDTYVADNNKKANIINVAVTVSDSASSAAKGVTFDSTSEVTAGGNIDVTLTFTVDSGGCSIGSQSSSKTISGMQEGNKQSRTWTVTQGTSGTCKYTISAAATGSSGIASKTDTTSSSVTCSDCPVDSGSPGGGSGGGGGGGSSATGTNIYEITGTKTIELAKNDWFSFKINAKEHKMTLTNYSDTTATITLESEKQEFTLNLEDEIKVELNDDNEIDLSIKLKSINTITKKVKFVVTRLSKVVLPAEEAPVSEEKETTSAEKEPARETASGIKKMIYYILAIIAAFGIILLAIKLLRHIEKKN